MPDRVMTPERRAYLARWQAELQKRRRIEWIEANGPCVRCGSADRLEVDHIDPATKVSSNIWSWSEKRRLAELAKCQVLCNACHLEKSIGEKRTTEHGTNGMYAHGCRCDECCAYKRRMRAPSKNRARDERRRLARLARAEA